MKKIGQFQAYAELTETDGAVFSHPEGQEDQARKIKMRVLSETPINLFLEPLMADYETGEFEQTRFLARIEPGMEAIEFYYRGDFRLTPVGGNVWLDTYDNTSFDVESLTPESYARLWEREERDPRILEIERAARHNTERFRLQMEADFAAHAQRMEERYAANVTQAASPVVAPAPSVPAQSATNPPTSDSGSAAPVADPTGGDIQTNA